MGYTDKNKQREYQREWAAARRAAFFSGKQCVKCGSTTNLELDHIDPTTKISHRIWSWSEQKQNVELAKCQVLCRLCHQDKSVIPRLARFEHGVTAYKSSRCRCDSCKTAARDYMRKWRMRGQQELTKVS